ncbi:hypothetical protein FRC04_000230 [Tulasnella sp. 424]|nr:hypothetical protein FRC04_000230 [Tulasnella sp. 424]KAG8982092.1 hypothetical protein FRC05_000234 [Tulasnella sp. 425]
MSQIMQRPTRPLTSRPPKPVSRPVKIAFAAGGLVLSAATLGLVLYEVSGGFTPSRSAATSGSLPLSTSHFTPVQVVSSEKSDSLGQHKLIKLKLARELTPPSSTVAPVFSVYLKDSDIQVERAYTPLKGLDENGEMLFWVKRYEHGEVGRWFHRQKVGEQVEIRGPMRTLDWEDGKWDEVVLISGGTGITPFYQLLHNVFTRTGDQKSSSEKVPLPRDTHFTLMHASRSVETLPPPVILDDLQKWARDNPDRLSLCLYVDAKEGDPSTSKDVRPGRINAKTIQEVREQRKLVKQPTWLEWLRGTATGPDRNKKVLFVVCGPEPMITDISGSRLGRPPSDGAAGGVLGNMGYRAEEVRKL